MLATNINKITIITMTIQKMITFITNIHISSKHDSEIEFEGWDSSTIEQVKWISK